MEKEKKFGSHKLSSLVLRDHSKKEGTKNDASTKDINAKDAGQKDKVKDASTKDVKEKDTGQKDNAKDAKAKDASQKDNAKDVKAKDASQKDNAKDVKAKDTGHKDNAKDAGQKDYAKDAGEKEKASGSKMKQPSKPTSKEPAKPGTDGQPKYTSKKAETRKPDNEAETQDTGISIEEFPPSHRHGPMKMRRVYYHEENDLADTLEDDPNIPKRPVADDLYSPWDEAVKSMRYASVISGLSMAIALVAEVAVNGTDKLTVDRVWLPVQFLRTVMNDKGETPPNILNFLEHIDVKTKDTGNPHPKEVFTIL